MYKEEDASAAWLSLQVSAIWKSSVSNSSKSSRERSNLLKNERCRFGVSFRAAVISTSTASIFRIFDAGFLKAAGFGKWSCRSFYILVSIFTGTTTSRNTFSKGFELVVIICIGSLCFFHTWFYCVDKIHNFYSNF